MRCRGWAIHRPVEKYRGRLCRSERPIALGLTTLGKTGSLGQGPSLLLCTVPAGSPPASPGLGKLLGTEGGKSNSAGNAKAGTISGRLRLGSWGSTGMAEGMLVLL